MKSSLFVVCCASLSWLYACNDIPPAPPEILPAAPTYTTITIDSQFFADYSYAIRYPSIVLSGATTLNLLFVLSETDQFRYAGCPVACDDRHNWRVGDVDSGIAGAWLGAAVARQELHTAFQARTPFPPGEYLKYGVCPGLCDRLASWRLTVIDTTGSSTGYAVSLAADSAAVHIAYFHPASPAELRYATCASNCGDFAGWSRAVIDTAAFMGETQIVRDAGGTIHVVYETYDQSESIVPTLRYGSCATNCPVAGSWQISVLGHGLHPDLSSTPDGRLHLAYLDLNHRIRVGHCGPGCHGAVDWQTSPLNQVSGVLTDVAFSISHDDRQHLVYSQSWPYGVVRYASCASGCQDSLGWHSLTIDSSDFDYFARLAVDSTGRVTVAHASSRTLRLTTIKQLP